MELKEIKSRIENGYYLHNTAQMFEDIRALLDMVEERDKEIERLRNKQKEDVWQFTETGDYVECEQCGSIHWCEFAEEEG